MGRPATIWLRKQTGWYYVTLNGEKVKLSPDKAEADRLFHELMAARPAKEDASPPGPSFRLQAHFLTSAAAHLKGRRAAEVKGHMLTAWLADENRKREAARKRGEKR